jgi:hypothetical protein
VPAGGATLRLACRGMATHEWRWQGPLTPRVRNCVLDDAAPLTGSLVTAAGDPAAGAVVVVVCRGQSAATVTDAAGAWRLPEVPLGTVRILASHPSGEADQNWRMRDGTACRLVLQDRRNPGCTLRVHGLPAAALAGASLRLFGPDPAALQHGGLVQLRGDATADIQLAEACLVQLVAPGFRGAAVVHRQSRQIELTARPYDPSGRRHTGRLLAATGGVRAAVRVWVRDRSHQDLGHAITDAAGQFAVQVATPADGCLRFGLHHLEGQLASDDRTFADGCSWVACQATNDPVELVADPVVRLTTVVRNQHGEGLAFAAVEVTDPADPTCPRLRTCADRTGTVQLGLPAGPSHLVATTATGDIAVATIHVVHDLPVQLRWTPVTTGEVRGTVGSADGSPLAGCEVELQRLELRTPEDTAVAMPERLQVRTDRAGRFRRRGLPEGRWSVTTPEQPGLAAVAFEVRQGEPAAVALSVPR